MIKKLNFWRMTLLLSSPPLLGLVLGVLGYFEEGKDDFSPYFYLSFGAVYLVILIYYFVRMISFTRDLDIMWESSAHFATCQTPDLQRSPHFLIAGLLSVVSLGLYRRQWYNSQQTKLINALPPDIRATSRIIKNGRCRQWYNLVKLFNLMADVHNQKVL
jgi:hypothetical protein